MGLRLNVGCGPTRLDGEIGVDLYETGGVDVRADLLALPFLDGSVEQVRMDHVLEHLPYRKCPTAVFEAVRALQPGGRLIVGVPDTLGTFGVYIAAHEQHPMVALPLKNAVLRHVYGSQTAEGQVHQSGWDSQTLADLLATAGLADVAVDAVDREDTGMPCIVGEGVKA